jgi:hypothetical protein
LFAVCPAPDVLKGEKYMKNLKCMSLFLTVIALFSCICYTQDKKPVYENVEVAKFEVKPETKFPDTDLEVLMSEIKEELANTKKFTDIKISGVNSAKPTDTAMVEKTNEAKPTDTAMVEKTNEAKPTDAAMPDKQMETKPAEAVLAENVLYVSGVITQYKEGNRAARYVIGFGAGRAKLKAHIKVADSKGNVLLEKDVDGNVVIGIFGGNSNGITRGLARELAKDMVKKFFKQ